MLSRNYRVTPARHLPGFVSGIERLVRNANWKIMNLTLAFLVRFWFGFVLEVQLGTNYSGTLNRTTALSEIFLFYFEIVTLHLVVLITFSQSLPKRPKHLKSPNKKKNQVNIPRVIVAVSAIFSLWRLLLTSTPVAARKMTQHGQFCAPFFSLPARTRAIFRIQWAEGVIRLIGQMKRENGYVKLNFWPGFWTCTVWEGLLQVRCCESWRAAAL